MSTIIEQLQEELAKATAEEQEKAYAALSERMRTYDGNFQGYPHFLEPDLELVREALEDDSIGVLCCFAADEVKTPEEYKRAKQFVTDFVENIWLCQMTESGNEVHESITE